jgi:hypothetical protein
MFEARDTNKENSNLHHMAEWWLSSARASKDVAAE